MKDNKLIITNNDGVEITCDVLFTFNSEETNHDYIVYTDNTYDKDLMNVYASIIKYDKDEVELIDIKSDKEWKIVESILASIDDKEAK